MKNTTKTVIFAIIAILTLSFTTLKTEKKDIKTESSKIVWKGYKVTGSQEGTINLKSGSLLFDNDKLTGGEFVIDMTTIVSTGLTGEYKGKLEDHLKSDDFFGVKKFPKATLIFTEVKSKGKNSYTITSDLTIKGKRNSVSFEISIYGNKATASLKIDRTKYGVKYGSTNFFDGLKDKAIYDEFDLVINLEF